MTSFCLLAHTSWLWARTLERDLAKQKNPTHRHHKDPLVLHAINVSRGRKETTLDVDVSNAAGRGTSRKVVLQNESKTITKAGVMVTIQPSDVAWDSDTDKIVILTVQPRISAGKLECLESMTGMMQDDKSVLPIKSQYLNLIPRL